MTEQDVVELAAILVNQHGQAALDVAERRREQHADRPRSDGFRLWTRIANAVARLMGLRDRHRSGETRLRPARRAARPRRSRLATPPPFVMQPRRVPQ